MKIYFPTSYNGLLMPYLTLMVHCVSAPSPYYRPQYQCRQNYNATIPTVCVGAALVKESKLIETAKYGWRKPAV